MRGGVRRISFQINVQTETQTSFLGGGGVRTKSSHRRLWGYNKRRNTEGWGRDWTNDQISGQSIVCSHLDNPCKCSTATSTAYSHHPKHDMAEILVVAVFGHKATTARMVLVSSGMRTKVNIEIY